METITIEGIRFIKRAVKYPIKHNNNVNTARGLCHICLTSLEKLN